MGVRLFYSAFLWGISPAGSGPSVDTPTQKWPSLCAPSRPSRCPRRAAARALSQLVLRHRGLTPTNAACLAQAAARPAVASRRPAARVVCQAQQEGPSIGAAVAAAVLAGVVGFGSVDAAKADIAGLTPCSESKAYAKRLKTQVKGLNKRLKQARLRGGAQISHARRALADRRSTRDQPGRVWGDLHGWGARRSEDGWLEDGWPLSRYRVWLHAAAAELGSRAMRSRCGAWLVALSAPPHRGGGVGTAGQWANWSCCCLQQALCIVHWQLRRSQLLWASWPALGAL
jgi:hypothetical protein